jgi:hypothetical protein
MTPVVYRHPLNNTVVTFRKVQQGQVKTEYTHKLYMFIQGTMVEIQTPAHWNLIGQSMTAPQPVYFTVVFFHHLQLTGLLLPWGKIWHKFKRCYYFSFLLLFYNCMSLKLCNLKFRECLYSISWKYLVSKSEHNTPY